MPEMDRNGAREIRRDIILALAGLEKQHGISIVVGPGTYLKGEGGRLRVKVTAIKVAAGAKVLEAAKPLTREEQVARERAIFILEGKAYGLVSEDYGKTFSSRNRTYALIAINPRRHKYPFIGKGIYTGKRYRFGFNILPVISVAAHQKVKQDQEAKRNAPTKVRELQPQQPRKPSSLYDVQPPDIEV